MEKSRNPVIPTVRNVVFYLEDANTMDTSRNSVILKFRNVVLYSEDANRPLAKLETP